MRPGGAFGALSEDAAGLAADGQTVGLGSGRAAAALVRALAARVRGEGLRIRGVPTSLQIKLVAEREGIPLVEADQAGGIDVAFDGADQIDAEGNMIKGGGGALLRENILASSARTLVIMADGSKFARRLCRAVPVEVHPLARRHVEAEVAGMGGRAELRTLDRGYPFVTENGNVVMDCDFGAIERPAALRRMLVGTAGVMEAGLFTRRPDVTYRARGGGRFDVIRRRAARPARRARARVR